MAWAKRGCRGNRADVRSDAGGSPRINRRPGPHGEFEQASKECKGGWYSEAEVARARIPRALSRSMSCNGLLKFALVAGVMITSTGRGFRRANAAAESAVVITCTMENDAAYQQVIQHLSSAMGAEMLCEKTAPAADGLIAQHSSQFATDDPQNKSPKKHDVVITPAGPVPKDKVHPVHPGETVRRNPDGSYTVVPKKNPKEKTRKKKVNNPKKGE